MDSNTYKPSPFISTPPFPIFPDYSQHQKSSHLFNKKYSDQTIYQKKHQNMLIVFITLSSLMSLLNSPAYNSLQQMSLEDFHRQQNALHALHTANSTLTLQNQEQGQEISRLNQRISELQAQVNNQPIHLITQQLDPLSQSNSLIQLEDKISLLTFQNAHLEQLLRDRSILLAEVHTQLNELAARLEESEQQSEELRHQLRSVNLREDRGRKEIEAWKGRLEKANQQRLKLISENSDLQQKLKQEQNKNYNALVETGKEIISFKEKASAPAKQGQQNKELEDILRLQQEELQERNAEIVRLKAINGNFGENSEVQHLKNTIKHLRGEISRYSNLVQHATEKLALAQTTIQRYSASAQKCDQELASVGELNERIQEQSQTIRNLQIELSRISDQIDKEKKLRNESKRTMIEILQENQCFHEFLFETYGDNFEELLKSVRNQYQERLRTRAQYEKWATVEELIEVNERLRIRLKIA